MVKKRKEQGEAMDDMIARKEKLKKDKADAYSKRKAAAEKEAKYKAAKAEKATVIKRDF